MKKIKYTKSLSAGKNNNAIAFVGGKSGGHIIPALTLAQQEVKNNKTTHILFFSTSSALDKKIISTSAIAPTHIPLPITPVNVKNPLQLIWCCLSFILAFFKSLYHLKKFRAQRVISMGGLVSLPVCFAAKLLRIPISIYELNAVPGKAVTLLAKTGADIYTCFKKTAQFFPKNKCLFSAYPIRYSANTLKIGKQKALKEIGLSPNKPTILILGGSQGSIFINTLIKQWIVSQPEQVKNVQIIHQTGSYDTTDWNIFYATHGISAHSFTYQDNLGIYYQAADIIICRSGAGTLFESIFFKKFIITIPLQSSATTNHQVDNANAFKKQYPHLIWVMNQKMLKKFPEELFGVLNSLLDIQYASHTTQKNKKTF